MSDDLNKLVDENDRDGMRKMLNAITTQYLYYIIIVIFTIVILVFMPMLGSSVEGGLNLPQTPSAWIIFIITRVAVAITNIIIFYSFMQQAKLNVQGNKYYKEANEILIKAKTVIEKKPLSPRKWESSQYLKKGSSLIIGTLTALFSLSQALLNYNYTELISYAITIFSALVFGIFQMKRAEIYWTTEYYQYAKMIEEIENKQYKELKDDSN